MSQNLEQLGPFGFQDLAAALAVKTFGTGVQVMGAGRDGGRDMYHRGQLIWSRVGEEPGEVWTGYTVFQVKHKAQLAPRPATDAAWLWGQIRAELDDWAEPSAGRAEVPDYLVIITNIPLSPVPGSGGHDLINNNIRAHIDSFDDARYDVGLGESRKAKHARLSKIKGWRLWDANQINAMLKLYPGIRRAFPGFFTAADVFAGLADYTDFIPVHQLEPALRAHARTTLIGEGSIYFDEAGSGDGAGTPVHEVVVDLPITQGDGERRSIVQLALRRGEHVLKPSMATFGGPRHLVLAGAPGNGKTTISKFLVQAYRAALLSGDEDLSNDHKRVISGTKDALGRMGAPFPLNRRWPMRIDLAEYAQERGLGGSSLISWIADKVTRRSDMGRVRASAMVSWMKHWPWLLVLDGLDEVTEPTARKNLIARVAELVTTAEADDCDMFVVLTTRPVGYSENIAPTQFERVDLDYLTAVEAMRYGELATRVRLRGDLDRIDKVIRHLHQAAQDEALANLLRTPLQVLIMTIIVASSGRLAPDRFSLFWSYYETVFKREREKLVPFRRVLQDYALQIQQLHERVGFELQVRSESAERSYATLDHHELKNITWTVLKDAGFRPSDVDSDLLGSLVEAATHRLVLIAPRGQGEDGYGFDVRPLQELMAAMYLTTGPWEDIAVRLNQAAASPHWRNAWIFGAGRVFATPQEHEQRALVELVESVDINAATRLGNIVPVGPRLALDLIDDGMVRSLPKWRARLAAHGLRVLREPPDPADILALTKILVRYADGGEDQQAEVADALRSALAGSPQSNACAQLVQRFVERVVDEIRAKARVRGLSVVKRRQNAGSPAEPATSVWTDFDDDIATYPIRHGDRGNLRLASAAVRRMSETESVSEDDVKAVAAALTEGEGDTARALAEALEHVCPDMQLVMSLRDKVLPAVYRTAIGESLR